MAIRWQKHVKYEVIVLNLVTRKMAATKNMQGQECT